jgi:hypothetical protein
MRTKVKAQVKIRDRQCTKAELDELNEGRHGKEGHWD